VGWQHARHGLDRPDRAEVVRAMLGATGRALGLAPTRKAALDVEGLRAIVATLRPGLAGARDRALLALGLSTGMRRSELVALDRADLRPVGTGFDVVIRKSKTDQARKGRVCTVAPGRFPATCPCRALTAWLAALDAEGIGDGAIFRAIDRHRRVLDRLTPAAVARIVQRAARDAGLDPAPLAGHSLRAGFVTAAARAQKPLHRIMEQSGHRSADVALAYIRDHG
jgi:integrase